MSEIDFTEVEAPPEATVETPAAETPVTPEAPPAPTVAALDAVLPDSEDIDESFRGKPIAEVTRIARQWKDEAKQRYEVGNRLNSVESKLELATRMLQSRALTQPQPAYAPPDPQQLLNEFAANPQGVLQRGVDERLNQQIAPVMQELQSLKMENYQQRSENARLTARQAAGVDADTWEALAKPLAAIIWANGGTPDNSQHWAMAFNEYKKPMSKFAPAAPAVPKQGNPPVGGARSTASPQSAAPRLSARMERDLAELADMAGIKKGTSAWDKLVKEITSDPIAMGGSVYE